MKNILRLFFYVMLFAGSFAACRPEKIKELKLSTDKVTMEADGVDKVTFEVICDGRKVTGAMIKSGDTKLDGYSFTTKEAGVHKFIASYDGAVSNEISVTASAVTHKLEIKADKLEIFNDGKAEAHFTVQLDGNKDVTSSSKIFGPGGSVLPSPLFRPADNGKYEFYATYNLDNTGLTDAMESNRIVIAVVEPALELKADKYRIAFDGIEEARFTVTFGEDNVTSAAQIIGPDENPLPVSVFKSSTAGEYRFHATYDFVRNDRPMSVRSNEITLYAADPRFIQARNVAFFFYTATWCAPCHTLKNTMKQVINNLGDQKKHIIQVNLHVDPKDDIGATSALTATMDQIAADGRFNVSGFPTAIIDLKKIMGSAPASNLRNIYNMYVRNIPKTGILVNSAITDDKINVTITVGAIATGNYSLGIFLVEDHIMAPQTGHDGQYDHTDVAREIGSHIMGDTLGAMTPGQTIEKTFSFDIKSAFKIDNLSLVVYTTHKEGSYQVIDNSRKITLTGPAEF